MFSQILARFIFPPVTIVVLPLLIFVLGEIFLAGLHHSGALPMTVCTPCTSKFSSTTYTLAATFSLALIVAVIVIWHSISQLIQMNSGSSWMISYATLGLLGFAIYNVVNINSTFSRSLAPYVELIPDYCSLTFGQSHVEIMLYVINTTFVLASFGVALSAAALTSRTKVKEIIECLYQLRNILMQGLGIFITGMTFMHFWMKYAIEVGVSTEMRKQMFDLAIGVQFYHAVLFLCIILVLAALTHQFLRGNYEAATRNIKAKAKVRAHDKDWKSTASYYRECIAAVGLFIPPLLGVFNVP